MRNAVTDAVRRLREALGDTQQQFAARTGLAISTVVRYELSRPPRGEILTRFKALADEKGLHDIAQAFAHAAGEPYETAVLHNVADALWWNRELIPDWQSLAETLQASLVQVIAAKRREPAGIAESLEELENRLYHFRRAAMSKVSAKIAAAAQRLIAKDPALTWDQARGQVLAKNADLYQEWHRERSDAAQGTHLAGQPPQPPKPQKRAPAPRRSEK
jgi:transcriptional regulator with XRE-family HTH domain